ncbi:hypothetical protein BKG82_26420 [Mycobacteroides chelonae]|uniref:Transglycosylase SLT domain-containing protein n=1 Tax=Mycobacteroides chelonae TaxID=1774 RepID=A0A1S1LC25_MYCCH|nr:hypothetical protein [Mycobacteroides chelonae]OHU47193.1 hypothetical protein BKG82_26420 [Mycobacteroides chelonae]
MTEQVGFDEDEAYSRFSRAQGTLQDHGSRIPAHDPTGIDDPSISDALDKHNKKTKDNIDKAGKTLDTGKKSLTEMGAEDRENAGKTSRIGPEQAAALKSALSRPSGPSGGGGAPMMAPAAAAPAPMPQAAPAMMAAPAAPQMAAVPAGYVSLAPDALQSLLDGAGVDGSTASGSGGGPVGGKAPINVDQIDFRKTGITTNLTKSQMLALADYSLDANGVSKDPQVRAIWREILQNQWWKECSGVIDAVNKDDLNAKDNPHNEFMADGAPKNSSRGVVQITPVNFAKFHVAGTSYSIYDPRANGPAGVAYMMATYNVAADGTGLTEFLARRRAAGYGGY